MELGTMGSIIVGDEEEEVVEDEEEIGESGNVEQVEDDKEEEENEEGRVPRCVESMVLVMGEAMVVMVCERERERCRKQD